MMKLYDGGAAQIRRQASAYHRGHTAEVGAAASAEFAVVGVFGSAFRTKHRLFTGPRRFAVVWLRTKLRPRRRKRSVILFFHTSEFSPTHRSSHAPVCAARLPLRQERERKAVSSPNPCSSSTHRRLCRRPRYFAASGP